MLGGVLGQASLIEDVRRPATEEEARLGVENLSCATSFFRLAG
jgi:hypothetical protein